MGGGRTERGHRRFSAAPRLLAWVLAAVLLTLSAGLAHTEDAARDSIPSPALLPVMAVSPGWSVSLGAEIVLDASTSDHGIPDERVAEIRYIWDLGDGTTQIGERVSHRFTSPGTFRVQLTMEVFERSGMFHRETETAELTVLLAQSPKFVTVIDLETGYAQTGDFAVLFQLEDQYLLVGRKQEPSSFPATEPKTPLHLPPELERFVISGGLITIGELRLWNGSVAMELAADGWLAFVGFGTNFETVSVSLSEFYPTVEHEGYALNGVIEQANWVTLGLCYEAAPNIYLLGSLGSLVIMGSYEGSSRLLVDDELLPTLFAGRAVTLSFGLGFRIGWLMLGVQALLTL